MVIVTVDLTADLSGELSARDLTAADVVEGALRYELDRRAHFDRYVRRSVDPNLLEDSSAEWQVLGYLATPLTLFEIGERLHISRATVKSYVISLYRKLGVNSRSAAVAYVGQVESRALLASASKGLTRHRSCVVHRRFPTRAGDRWTSRH